MQPHQCWAESTPFNQLATIFLKQPRRLSAIFAMAVYYWHTDGCQPAHQATSLQSCSWCGILQFPLLYFKIPLSKNLQPGCIPLNANTYGIWGTPLCFVPSVIFLVVHCPSIQAINEDAGLHLPHYQFLGYMTDDLTPAGLCVTDHKSLGPIIQSVLNLLHCPLL